MQLQRKTYTERHGQAEIQTAEQTQTDKQTDGQKYSQ